jgi:hypothetical protein
MATITVLAGGVKPRPTTPKKHVLLYLYILVSCSVLLKMNLAYSEVVF